MKITDVKMVLMTSTYRTTERLRSYAIAVVETEDGRIGVGEALPGVTLPTVCREMIEVLKPLFVGADARDYNKLVSHAQALAEYFDHRGMLSCVLGAVDWALHDLAAQRENLPLHKFLNPNSKSSVELYASTGVMSFSKPALLDEVETRIAEGYQTIKVRIGCGIEGADASIQRAQAVMDRVAGRAKLCVDSGQQIFIRNRWSFDDAVRVAEALGDMGVFFFEDAYLIHDRQAYCKLRALKRVPIAGGEMFNDPADFERYITAGAFDIAQPDASVLPGPAAVLAVCKTAEAHGVPTIFHGWTGPVAQLQNIHVALACNSGDVVEYCPLHNPLLMDGLQPIWNFDRGRLAAPSVPGMGAAPIRDLAEKYPFQGISSFIA